MIFWGVGLIEGMAYLNLHVLRATTVKKSGIISYVLYKKLLETTKTLMHFDSNVNRDEMNEKKVAKTVIRIKC